MEPLVTWTKFPVFWVGDPSLSPPPSLAEALPPKQPPVILSLPLRSPSKNHQLFSLQMIKDLWISYLPLPIDPLLWIQCSLRVQMKLGHRTRLSGPDPTPDLVVTEGLRRLWLCHFRSLRPPEYDGFQFRLTPPSPPETYVIGTLLSQRNPRHSLISLSLPCSLINPPGKIVGNSYRFCSTQRRGTRF